MIVIAGEGDEYLGPLGVFAAARQIRTRDPVARLRRAFSPIVHCNVRTLDMAVN
jgi:hypothetical protein